MNLLFIDFCSIKVLNCELIGEIKSIIGKIKSIIGGVSENLRIAL